MSVVLLHRCPPGCCWIDPVLHRNLRTLEFLGFAGFLWASPDLLQLDLLDLLVLGKPGGTIGGVTPQMRSDVTLERVRAAAATGARLN